MTDPGAAPDPLAAITGVMKELQATRAEVVRLRTYGRRNRKFIVFDIILTVLLTALSGGVVHAIQSAGHANSAQLALCQAGNTARAQQIGIWEFLLKLGNQPRTAHEKQVVDEFLAHLHQVFAPRDCASLGQK